MALVMCFSSSWMMMPYMARDVYGAVVFGVLGVLFLVDEDHSGRQLDMWYFVPQKMGGGGHRQVLRACFWGRGGTPELIPCWSLVSHIRLWACFLMSSLQ